MPPLTPLLDVQEIDLASDRLQARRRTLPERSERERVVAEAAALDEQHADLIRQREALSQSEHDLDAEVAAIAAKAKEVEDHLYSGSVKVSKELAALQEEIRLLRARQSGLEEQEMELLEEIEQTEADMAANRAERTQRDEASASLASAIGEAEQQIDGELADLSGQRTTTAASVPTDVLTEYDRLRTKPKMAGRAAAPLADGSCGGCRVKLPVLEQSRIKAQPEDALICCVHCGRVLVR